MPAPAPSGRVSPVGTAHRLKPSRPKAKSIIRKTAEKLEEIRREIESLPGLIKSAYKSWTDGAKKFQLEGICAQVQGVDVLLHAATGSGKTGIAAAPHLLPSSKGKTTIMVSPLLALQDEQVETFKDEFNLRAIAINSNNGGCTTTIINVRTQFCSLYCILISFFEGNCVRALPDSDFIARNATLSALSRQCFTKARIWRAMSIRLH